MKTRLVLLAIAVAIVTGCTVKFRGQPLFGLDPNGTLLYGHPEVTASNVYVVPHD